MASLACAAPAPEPAVIEVPFTSPRHQIVVRVTLDEHGPYNMLLDTGTDPSAVDAALARSLRTPADTTLHEGTGTGSGPIRAFAWTMHGVRVGAVRADSVPAAAIDLSRPAAKLGIALHGVLGYSFLAGRIVQIDYARHVVRFYHDRVPPPTRQQVAEFPMWPDSADVIPRVHARVNGRDVVLAYDSGSSGHLAVSQLAVERLGLAVAFASARRDSAVGYGGQVETREGRVRSMAIGALRFTDVPCMFAGRHAGMLADTTIADAKIGNALLENVVVTLDYRAMTVRFER